MGFSFPGLKSWSVLQVKRCVFQVVFLSNDWLGILTRKFLWGKAGGTGILASFVLGWINWELAISLWALLMPSEKLFFWEGNIQTLHFLCSISFSFFFFFFGKISLIWKIFIIYLCVCVGNTTNWSSGQRIWVRIWWWRLIQLFCFANHQLVP